MPKPHTLCSKMAQRSEWMKLQTVFGRKAGVLVLVVFACGWSLITLNVLSGKEVWYIRNLNSNMLILLSNKVLDRKVFTTSMDFNEMDYIMGEFKDTDSYKRNLFNLTASDELFSDRMIPDTRQEECHGQVYNKSLPSTSVIICFHNEARSTLLRTVTSVLNRSPPNLIHEIILVDDFSDDPNDGLLLESIPKVKVLRNNEREGLVRSRIKGADYATAPVLTFLDSHCECNVGWLEPLLQRVMEDSRVVVCPVIDLINLNTFTYSGTNPLLRAGYYKVKQCISTVFDWKLQLTWNLLPERLNQKRVSPVDPVKTPVIAGGLFAINRRRFIVTGKYDPEMDIWGGENFEISFRTWMCGGSMEIIPCSRVGHVFRVTQPYSKGNTKTFTRNLNRVAEVWMDNYTTFYYFAKSNSKDSGFGNITERVTLRRRLKCNSFHWYINNIYPELKNMFGEIKQDGYCLELVEHDQSVHIMPCNSRKVTQIWIHTAYRTLENHGLSLEGGKDGFVRLKSAYLGLLSQQWIYSKHDETIRNLANGYCLSRSHSTSVKPNGDASLHSNTVTLKRCFKRGTSSQTWTISLPTILQ